jgi:tripartite-type tricarboxylate transporter receptor subunit TctC
MKPPRRRFLRLAAGAAALPAVSRFALAQGYPSRPITLGVPFPPGGTTDVVGRIMGKRIAELLGQSVMIENVTGSGNLGVGRGGRGARAAPNGYTLCIGQTARTSSMALRTPVRLAE